VGAGALFVAIPGRTVDGNAFIPAALEAGAAAVVVQEDRRASWERHLRRGAAFVAVPDARVALAEAAAAFYAYPARELGMVGVTGTDGKTTTTHLTAHVLHHTAGPAGFLSSVAFGVGDESEMNVSHMTTLEANDVQRHLARIRDAGARYAVVEASSIGLDMHRVDQCEFDVGVFTNLTQDHLDYHGTMEAYLDAKAILFRMVDASIDKGFTKAAVLNADDPASAAIARATKTQAITYGLKAEAAFTAREIALDGWGMRFTLRHGQETIAAYVPLLGEYNVANAIAAVAVARSQGVSAGDAVAALASFAGVPGRMELIDQGQPFRVVVDIASTEQAMRNVLTMLRAVAGGEIIVVFGAAGERDRARRSGIARAVREQASFAVITNEDPRSEDPEAIIEEIASALRDGGWREGERFAREPDRREAIRMAFERARPGDTVLLAGKATEPSIVIGTRHIPWDERAVARELLRGRV